MARSLGGAIRSRRIEMGLTREDMAERVEGNMRQAEISRIEANRVALPCRERLECIARALGLPIEELLELAGVSGPSADITAPTVSLQGNHQERVTAFRDNAAPSYDQMRAWAD